MKGIRIDKLKTLIPEVDRFLNGGIPRSSIVQVTYSGNINPRLFLQQLLFSALKFFPKVLYVDSEWKIDFSLLENICRESGEKLEPLLGKLIYVKVRNVQELDLALKEAISKQIRIVFVDSFNAPLETLSPIERRKHIIKILRTFDDIADGGDGIVIFLNRLTAIPYLKVEVPLASTLIQLVVTLEFHLKPMGKRILLEVKPVWLKPKIGYFKLKLTKLGYEVEGTYNSYRTPREIPN